MRFRSVVFLALCLWPLAAVQAASRCSPDRAQASGSPYRICMPDAAAYNGRLVIWAHGFQDATEPVGIPDAQSQLGDTSLAELFNDLGFGYAEPGYAKTGLAVRQGMADILDLVDLYAAEQGKPEKIYLTGASEGGLIAGLLLERHPDIFAGGVAACAPLGDFAAELDYLFDARATFQAFFPTAIPGDPFNPADDLIQNWDSVYASAVEPAVFDPSQAKSLKKWFKLARLPIDAARAASSRSATAALVLRYGAVNLNDAVATLGGFPYDNLQREYPAGLDVPRIGADAAALAEVQTHYQTSGNPQVPLVTLHTTLDPLIPYDQAKRYLEKTRDSGAYPRRHIPLRIARYGHCNFNRNEVTFALLILGLLAEDEIIQNLAQGATTDIKLLKTFLQLAQSNGLSFRLEKGRLRLILPRG